MFSSEFQRRTVPLTPSEVACLRVWLPSTSRIPAPPYVGAVPPSPEQALLLFSLTYGAGVQANELAAMRVDALVDEHGFPRRSVLIRPETTKHRRGCSRPMHPDVRLDLHRFRRRHPRELYVAFVPSPTGQPSERTMSEHGLTQWFRALFRAADLGAATVRSGRKMFTDMQRRT